MIPLQCGFPGGTPAIGSAREFESGCGKIEFAFPSMLVYA